MNKDHDLKHTAKFTSDWFRNNKEKVLDWPTEKVQTKTNQNEILLSKLILWMFFF